MLLSTSDKTQSDKIRPNEDGDVPMSKSSPALAPTAETVFALPCSNAEPLPDRDHHQQQSSHFHHPLPRLVPRSLPFYQSENVIQVSHRLKTGWQLYRLLRHDLFHVFLRLPTYQSLFVLLLVWTAMVLFFAVLYYGVVERRGPAEACGLGRAGDPISLSGSFAFSLQTTTTVGYTLPNGTNAFFENCQDLQVVIFLQVVWSMMFNALLFAFFYSRLAKSESRGVQVVASDKALVSIVDGQVRFQVRLYDVDAKHPVVESHVRLYVIKRSRPTPQLLRLLQPNDEFKGTLLLSLPTIISHHVDVYSLLHPPVPNLPITQQQHSYRLTLRQADSVIGFRKEVICPICGENYSTHAVWVKHVKYQQQIETNEKYPMQGTHLSLSEKDLIVPKHAAITDLRVLKDYFAREISEVICVVEGIDPLTSGSFQALHSYRYQDVVFDAQGLFEPCLETSERNVCVDLDRFHEIRLSQHRVLSTRQLNVSAFQ